MFPKYPYLDLSDRNLDMLTRAIREMENEVKNFVSLNAVKYANPIQWSINRQYEKNTIVIDPLTGTAFISVQPVPNGVSLTRTQYWTPVFDLSQFVTKAASNFANSYERDITTTATMPTGAGDWVVWDSTLYVALTSIHAGDTYVVNGNIKRMTVEDFYDLLMQAIHSLDEELDTEIRNRTDADTTLQGNIDAEARARGEADTTLQGNIDAEARARGEADTALQGNIDAEARARGEADTALQGNIDAEARARQQADGTLHTDLVNYTLTREPTFNSRRFIFCGDSYGDESGEWADMLITQYNLTSRATNMCYAGAGFVSSGSPYLFIEELERFVDAHTNDECVAITDIVVCGGLNDSFWTVPSDYTGVTNAMSNFNTYAKTHFPNATISLGYIGNGNDYDTNSLISVRTYAARQLCLYTYYKKGSELGWRILKNVETLLTGSVVNISADGVHPSVFGSNELSSGIGEALVSGGCDYNYPNYTLALSSTIGTSTGDAYFNIHNREAHIHMRSFGMNVNSGTIFSSGTAVAIATIGTLGFNDAVNVECTVITYNASEGGSANTSYNAIKGRLTFLHDKLYLTFLSADGSGYKTVNYTSTGTLIITDLDFTFDSLVLV